MDDFLVRVFSAAFSGHDFSVMVFWVALSLLTLTLATLLLCICTNLSDGEKTPGWGKVVTICVGLTVAVMVGVVLT